MRCALNALLARCAFQVCRALHELSLHTPRTYATLGRDFQRPFTENLLAPGVFGRIYVSAPRDKRFKDRKDVKKLVNVENVVKWKDYNEAVCNT